MNYSFNRSIRIHVIDIYDNPVKGAIVHLGNRHNLLRVDETTASGHAYMEQVPGGIYDVMVKYKGVSKTVEVEVDNGTNDPIDITVVMDIE